MTKDEYLRGYRQGIHAAWAAMVLAAGRRDDFDVPEDFIESAQYAVHQLGFGPPGSGGRVDDMNWIIAYLPREIVEELIQKEPPVEYATWVQAELRTVAFDVFKDRYDYLHSLAMRAAGAVSE